MLSLRPRAGFTIIEMIVVAVIGTIIVSMVIPSINRGMNSTRAQRAASIMAADLQLAFSLAARQRRPVVIVVDTAARTLRIRDFVNTTTVYSNRLFTPASGSDVALNRFGSNRTSVNIFPSGLASTSLTLTAVAGSHTRTVTMSRAGQVRVSSP